ncbi:MAG TPA: proton-conducting transporter membrane subunit, partial [Kiloniellales bacterium]|nr:proton-conducting transporter membrane subunit [Kiloniellales bacterium]
MSFLAAHAVFWPVAIPICVAALCGVFWLRPSIQRTISLAGIVLMAAAALLLLIVVMENGTQAIAFGDWPPPFGIGFVADLLGAAMVMIAGMLALAAGIFGLADIRPRQEYAGFHPLLHGMLAAVNGAFLTGDIFNLYVWFEIMLITVLGLLVIDRTRAQLDGAIKYAVLNLLGTLLFLLAVALLYGVTGTLNIADLSVVLRETEPSTALALSAALFLLALGIKAGFFPLFFWLPASYHTAAITVSALL